MNELNKVLALAQRDLMKFLRDRDRIVATFIFPLIFIGVMGLSFNAGFGGASFGVSFLDYLFVGILIQSVFQSSAAGIISLVSDREKDFAMSIFVAPVSRYSIVLGKIIGETLVSSAQVVGIMILGKIMGVNFSVIQVLSLLPIVILASFVGAGFGVLVASRINNDQGAQRIFPFLIFPIIFTAGTFTPVNNLPIVLQVLKVINPLFYGIDAGRNLYFAGNPHLSTVVSNGFLLDVSIFFGLGILFFLLGTYLFTQKEGNK